MNGSTRPSARAIPRSPPLAPRACGPTWRFERYLTKTAAALFGLVAAGIGAMPASGAELLMFEQKACPFCDAFNREIAPDYPRSRAGAIAPLRLVDIWESRTGGIEGLEPAVFTPTFVLVDDHREIGRLLGYPGRRYFYQEIQILLDRLNGSGPPGANAVTPPAEAKAP